MKPGQPPGKARAAPGRAGRHGSPSSWIDLDPEGVGLAVEDFPTLRLAAVSALLHRKVTRQYLGESGLSLPEWRMLTLLERHGPVSARRVSLDSGMDKAQISRAIGLLVERGLAVRDGGATPQAVDLTPAGRRLYDTILPVARRSQASLLQRLSLADRKALGSVLAKLAAIAERLPAEPRPRRARAAAPSGQGPMSPAGSSATAGGGG